MLFNEPPLSQIAKFLRDIGITIRSGTVEDKTILPGILVEHGGLVIDEARLKYPGDILHEAGHLAVVPPDRRNDMHRDVGRDAAEEMMAIAWSYAAALYIGIDPGIVFHEGGYRGGGASLLDNFQSGHYFAVPMLQWVGMAYEQKKSLEAGVAPYPHMHRWLRPA